MQSVQTKEVPSALSNLLKAKGQLPSGRVMPPAAVMVETPSIEVLATPEQTPEPAAMVEEPVKPEVPDTSNQNLDPSDKRNYEQAWKELKQHHDKTIFELRTENKQLKDSLTQANAVKTVPPKTKEEILEFKKQNPEAFDIMRSIALETSGEESTELKQRLEEVNKLTAELKEKEAFKKLLEDHPDAMEIKKSPQFLAWFNEQPDDIKLILAKSSDIKAVSKQLTLYKLEVLGINPKEKNKADSKKREENSIAVDVKSKVEVTPQKKIWTGSEIRAICSDYNAWNKHRAEIDLARREGRVDESK